MNWKPQYHPSAFKREQWEKEKLIETENYKLKLTRSEMGDLVYDLFCKQQLQFSSFSWNLIMRIK